MNFALIALLVLVLHFSTKRELRQISAKNRNDQVKLTAYLAKRITAAIKDSYKSRNS